MSMMNASVIWKHRARSRVICIQTLECLFQKSKKNCATMLLVFFRHSSISLRKRERRRPTSFQMKHIITVGVERSIAPTMVPAKFYWQEIFLESTTFPSRFSCMWLVHLLNNQVTQTNLFFRTVEHMTKELKDPFHYRDDHLTNDKFQRCVVRMTEEAYYLRYSRWPFINEAKGCESKKNSS